MNTKINALLIGQNVWTEDLGNDNFKISWVDSAGVAGYLVSIIDKVRALFLYPLEPQSYKRTYHRIKCIYIFVPLFRQFYSFSKRLK
jgi:hypothetical protein